MKQSAISLFPFKNDYENNCLARAHTTNDTVLSAIRAWLVTRRGSRLGNMVGCFLPDILFELVAFKDLKGLSSQLKSDLAQQFPGVTFYSVSMTIDSPNNVVELNVSIKLSTKNTEITDLEVTMPLGQSN